MPHRRLLVLASLGYPDELMDSWREVPLDATLPLSVAVLSERPVWCPSHDDVVARFPQLRAVPTMQRSALLAIPVGRRRPPCPSSAAATGPGP